MGIRGPRLAVLVVGAAALWSCAPIRVDDRPQIRGRLVAVSPGSLGIRHKTGPTYTVEIASDTRIINARRQAGEKDLCPGQRALVILSRSDRSRATEVYVSGGRCDQR